MRLIDADKLQEFPIRKGRCDKEHANEHFIFGIESVLEYAENLPAADVAPVVHGRWVHTDLAYHWTSLDECGVCGYHDEKRQHLGNYSYCPNCGAKMDGGDDDE